MEGLKAGENPLVTVLAVCYNHAQYVVETLNSIVNQTYKNIELIIVDSNSSDNSVEIIEEWITGQDVKCVFIKQKEPKNVCQNINEGMQYMNGEYLQLISCDDVLLENKIARQYQIFNTFEEVDVVFSVVEKIDENSDVVNRFFTLDSSLEEGLQNSAILMKKMIRGNVIVAPSVLFRVKSLPSLPVYNEELLFEDLYLYLILLKAGKLFYLINEALAQYRVLSNSLYRSTAKTKRYLNDRNEIISSYQGISLKLDILIFKKLNSSISLKEGVIGFFSGSVSFLQLLVLVAQKIKPRN